MEERSLDSPKTPKSRDYFAEMYVAGHLADVGWNVYFPRRDNGFDCIITKQVGSETLIRPVQVKGKYPSADKTDKQVYGYVGDLSIVHPAMVLAIVFFDRGGMGRHPLHVAYMPFDCIKPNARGFRCEPATIQGGKVFPRRDFVVYFDEAGRGRLEIGLQRQ